MMYVSTGIMEHDSLQRGKKENCGRRGEKKARNVGLSGGGAVPQSWGGRPGEGGWKNKKKRRRRRRRRRKVKLKRKKEEQNKSKKRAKSKQRRENNGKQGKTGK